MEPFVKTPFEARMLSAVQKKNKIWKRIQGIGSNQGLIVNLRLKENWVMLATEYKYTECVIAAKRRAAKMQNELQQSNQLRENWMGYNKS